MTITEAVKLLKAVHDKHGDVEVYFDCPFCDKSFAPTVVKALGVHVTARAVGVQAPAGKETP